MTPSGIPSTPVHALEPVLGAQTAKEQDREIGESQRVGPDGGTLRAQGTQWPQHMAGVRNLNPHASPKRYQDIVSQHAQRPCYNSAKSGVRGAPAGVSDSALPCTRHRVTRINQLIELPPREPCLTQPTCCGASLRAPAAPSWNLCSAA